MTDNNAYETAAGSKRNWFSRFLDTVEWLGNLLPHPVTLFALLAFGMVLLSGFFGWLDLAVLFLLWTFGLDLPVGPGSPTYYTAGQ